MTASTPDEALREQIAKETARLAQLEAELNSTKARLGELQSRIPAGSSVPDRAPLLLVKGLKVQEKVALFKSLFRGRDDVYPRLWENIQVNTQECKKFHWQKWSGNSPMSSDRQELAGNREFAKNHNRIDLMSD